MNARAMQALALTAAVLCMVSGNPSVRAEEAPAWPADVPGFKAPVSGEHPRLFFRRTDIPALRKRAQTAEGKALIARLEALLGEGIEQILSGDEEEKAKQHTISHVAGYGFLYQLTGNRKYADKGRRAMELSMQGMPDVDGRYAWKSPNGALRAGPSLGWHAVGYDLCYDGWDEAFRREVAMAIQNYNAGRYCSLGELVRGSRHFPGSNHWGMQVGGGALAGLAIRGDPGVDNDRLEALIRESEHSMIRNLTEGFGDHGSFAEGDGTGVMSSHIVFLPALQAWRVAAGRDFCSPRPNARWTCLKFVMLTIARDGNPLFPKRGGYPQNVWSRTGMSGPGTFCEGFGIVNQDEKPALLWLYNRTWRALDEKENTPFETASIYPHRAIMAFVNWPFGVREENPGKILPRLVVDEWSGRCMFRSRWKDGDDCIVDAQLKGTRGWMKSGGGHIHVWGLGRQSSFPMAMAGEPTVIEPGEHGGVVSTETQSLGVDFSGLSGVDALVVMAGTGDPIAGAGEAVTMEAGGRRFTIMLLAKDKTPEPKVAGDKVVVGKRTIMYDGKKIVFGGP